MKSVILDTGYWLALVKQEHDKKDVIDFIGKLIDQANHKIIIPYPSLYEFLNSKFSRKKYVLNISDEFSKEKYEFVYDEKYREDALAEFLKSFSYDFEDISLVDEIIKGMILDTSLKTDYIVSFDSGLKNFASSYGVICIDEEYLQSIA